MGVVGWVFSGTIKLYSLEIPSYTYRSLIKCNEYLDVTFNCPTCGSALESNHRTIKPPDTQMDYSSPNDLPLPLRQKLVELRRTGMPIHEIARLFFLPVDWVVLFVETPPGSTEH